MLFYKLNLNKKARTINMKIIQIRANEPNWFLV